MVTFELALAVPALLLVCLFCAWLLRLGQVQVQLDDATRAAARDLARGATAAAATESASRVLPGSRFRIERSPTALVVSGSYHLRAPVPVLNGLGVHLDSQLHTTAER